MSELIIKRVWIEPAECTGHTLCVPEAPGLIAYDKKADVSVVLENSLKRTHQELKQLLEASEVCPMLAFFIQTSDGSTFNASNELIRSVIRKGHYKWA
jgi:ferredoxin